MHAIKLNSPPDVVFHQMPSEAEVVRQFGVSIGCSGSGIQFGQFTRLIAVKELVPIILAVAVWGSYWQYKSIRVH